MKQTITLDTSKAETNRACLFPLRRGERNNVELTVAVRREHRTYDLAGMTAHLFWQAADGKLVGPVPMEVIDTAVGTVRCTLPDACYAAVGMARAYVELRSGEELVDTTDELCVNVLECIDADAEQAEEYKPLIAEVRDATEKALESRIINAEAKTLEPGSDATARLVPEGGAQCLLIGIPRGDTGAKGDRGEKGEKGDPFTYKDFTDEQISELQRPAIEAAADAKSAIAEVKATEAKLYPAAENILVGSETGTVAHVEDAFDGSTLRKITVEGACRQDGTPSPDSHVPIEVVEHPVVKVTGRNLVDNKYPTYIAAYNNGIAIVNKYSYNNPSAVLPFTTGPRSSDGFGFIEKLKPNVTYTLKVFNAPDKSVVCIAGYKNVEDIANASSAIWHIKEISLKSPVQFTVKEGGEYVVFSFAAIWGDGNNKITYPAEFKATVECGSTATEYKPYTSQTLTLTLPAEHPYLAKLPDGTADEIVVDEEGNVELVARVAKLLPSEQNLAFVQCGDDFASYVSIKFANDSESKKRLMSSAYEATRYTTESGYIYCPEKISMVIRDNRFTSEAQARELLNGVVVYVAVEPTRYPLGKIEMPKAQDSIVNAWTDAEVTPNTGIEYVRDVNIVVANLESAIASITEG